MEITPRELRDIEIHSEIRGYSRDEVNDLLERAALAIEASHERISQLQDRLASAQGEAVRTRETEDILHRTLLLAQRAADEAVAEATAKARQLVDDAETSSRRLLSEAEGEARRQGESERRRLEAEIVDLAGRRDTLLADVEALTRFEADYRERMVRALETDLTSLRTRTAAPAAVPETSNVEIPREEYTPPAPSEEIPAVAEAPAESPVVNEPIVAAAPQPEPTAATGGSDANGSGDVARAATSEVDMQSLFESADRAETNGSATASAPAMHPAAASSALRDAATAARPIDLAVEPVDADILDDDAFFATLRDAVHDEKPLGPRDDDDLTGEHQFFDQDADRGGFRDVFRRRR